jgi:hypothetical protein
VSRTVIAALTHRVSCPAKESAFPAQCPWRCIAGCKLQFKSQQPLSTHQKKHIYDTRGTFICRGKCGNHYADVYSLVSHEQKCVLVASKPGTKLRIHKQWEFRFLLNTFEKPSVIYVARSSGDFPKVWLCRRSNLSDGLPIWIQPRRLEYERIFGDHRPAVFHAGSKMSTAFLPAPAEPHVVESELDWRRYSPYIQRAHRMTAAITKDVQDCPDRPTIVSLGTDAWSCSTVNIQGYLSLMQTPFTLVICHSGIYTGREEQLSTQYLRRGRNGLWWGSYTSTELLAGLINFDNARPAVKELITTWRTMQAVKEMSRGDNSLAHRTQ